MNKARLKQKRIEFPISKEQVDYLEQRLSTMDEQLEQHHNHYLVNYRQANKHVIISLKLGIRDVAAMAVFDYEFSENKRLRNLAEQVLIRYNKLSGMVATREAYHLAVYTYIQYISIDGFYIRYTE